jgi:hypothetical protein
MSYLIVNTDEHSLYESLKGEIPETAVLATATGTHQEACILAKMILKGGAGKEKRESLLLLDPDHPDSQKTTKYYRADWMKTSYAYRMPCGNWENCENPEGPATVHYSPPSKNPEREGPALCRYCRHEKGPTQLNRDRTAQKNRDRTKTKVAA